MKLMKSTLLFCLLLLVGGCTKETDRVSYYELTLNGCAQKKFNDETATLCLDAVLSDSRCPKASTCVWAGVAEARFVFKVQGQQHSFALATSALSLHYPTDTVISGYSIRLIDLLPYPGDPAEETRAVVEITK